MHSIDHVEAHAPPIGLELVDCRRVGLPVYHVYMDVLVEERRNLHLITEYALRLIRAGVHSLTDVSELLGLPQSTVRFALVDAVQTKAIVGEEDDLQVTLAGKDLLDGCGEMECHEATWLVPFDGLLCKPYGWRRENLLTPGQLLDLGHTFEVGPLGERPGINGLAPDAVWRVLNDMQSGEPIDRLLEVRGVQRAPIRYVPALALGYRGQDRTHVAFFFDGRPLDEHTAIFSKSGALRRPMFRGLARRDPELSKCRATVRRRLTTTLGSEAKRAAAGVLTLNPPVARKGTTDPLPITRLFKLLDQALDHAEWRLALTTRDVSQRFLNETFLQRLRKVASSGVRIYIGLEVDPSSLTEHQAGALQKLQSLDTTEGITIGFIPAQASTILLYDTTTLLLSTWDWLVADGSSAHALQERWAIESTSPDLIDKEADRVIDLIETGANGQRRR